jgi:hypothetical protein
MDHLMFITPNARNDTASNLKKARFCIESIKMGVVSDCKKTRFFYSCRIVTRKENKVRICSCN